MKDNMCECKLKTVPVELKKTKTERFVEMVDDLEIGGNGVLIDLGGTHHQTFRTMVMRHYDKIGPRRTFMMKQTPDGLLVWRVK